MAWHVAIIIIGIHAFSPLYDRGKLTLFVLILKYTITGCHRATVAVREIIEVHVAFHSLI